MSDPEPIEVNELAQAAVLVAQRADGQYIPVRVADDGTLVAGGGGGGGGDVVVGEIDQGTAAALAGAWPVKITDATFVLGTFAHPLRVDPTGGTAQPVTVSALPLPTGAATEASLASALAKLTNIDGDSQQTVTLLTSLVAAIATEVTQAAVRQALESIDAKVPALGQAVRAASTPVTIATDQTAFGVNAAQTGTWNVGVTSLPDSPAQEHTTANSAHAVRLTDGAGFYAGLQRGGDVKADLRIGSSDVSSSNPVPINDAGGSLTVDSTQLPSALESGRLAVRQLGPTTSLVTTTIASGQSGTALGSLTWSGTLGAPRALFFQAPSGNAAACYVGPVSDSGTKGIRIDPDAQISIDDNPDPTAIAVRVTGSDTIEATAQR